MATVVTIDSEGTYSPFLALGPYSYGGNLYVISCDLNTYQLMAYRSTDSGATWANVSASGPEIDRYTVMVGPTADVRNTVAAAHFDGSLIHCIYYQAAATEADAYITHCSFNPATLSWSSETAASWSTSGSEAAVANAPFVCEWPGGGLLAGWTEYNSSGGWTRAVIGRFDGGVWSSVATVASGTYSTSSCRGVAQNTETGGAHVIIGAGGALNHVAIASDMTEGAVTFVSGSTGGAAFSVSSWVYGGDEYLAVLWTESTRIEAGVTLSSSISFNSKTVYTRDVAEESALGFCGVLAPSGPSLHAFWWWATSPPTTEEFRLYKSCFDYRAGIDWTTAEQIATHDTSEFDNEPGMINGYASGSTFRGCYAPDEMNVLGGGSAGDGFVKYFTESLTSCAAATCCCANFAY
jgi:hypothetical protein